MDDLFTFYNKKSEELKKEGKFEEALEFKDKAIQIQQDEKSPEYFYKKGIQDCEMGKYEEALEKFDKDLTTRGSSYETFFAKGKILLNLKKYSEAVECFNKASEEHDKHYLNSTKKVEHMKKAHKFEKALVYTDLALNEQPLDDTFWYHKGMALLKLKKYEVASSCFKKSLEIKNDDPKLLYELAKCEFFDGNKEEFWKIMESACELEPQNKEKLRVDVDFPDLSKEEKFRILMEF